MILILFLLAWILACGAVIIFFIGATKKEKEVYDAYFYNENTHPKA